MSQPLIIVSAGLAGWTTAREFRKLDTTLAGNRTAASVGIWHWLDDAGQPRSGWRRPKC